MTHPNTVAKLLNNCLDTRWPAFIWGPPGVGKSSIVRQVADQRGLPLIDLRAPLLDPTDIRGIPRVTQDGIAEWCPPNFLPRADQPEGILFLDELSAAPSLVQASLYQLTLDRRVGDYELPAGWRIVAAGNRSQDGCVVFRMPAALANRFVHIDLDVYHLEWIEWAQARGIHDRVVQFISTRPDMLHKPSSTERAFPTPRSWEMASDLITSIGDEGLDATEALLGGIIGQAATIEYLAFTHSALSEADILRIISEPFEANIPNDPGSLYALIEYLMHNLRKTEVEMACDALVLQLPVEFAVVLARRVSSANPKLLSRDGFRKFFSRHGETILCS